MDSAIYFYITEGLANKYMIKSMERTSDKKPKYPKMLIKKLCCNKMKKPKTLKEKILLLEITFIMFNDFPLAEAKRMHCFTCLTCKWPFVMWRTWMHRFEVAWVMYIRTHPKW